MDKAKQDILNYIKCNLYDMDTNDCEKSIKDFFNKTKLYCICNDLLKEINKNLYIESNIIMMKQKYYNQVYLNEIKEMEIIFKNNDIKVIYLKGITLAYELYDPIQTRIFHDIDVLIDYNDAVQCINNLKNLGYYSEKEFKNTEEIKIEIKLNNHLELFKKLDGKTIHLEIHGAILNPPNIFNSYTKEFIDRSTKIKVEDIYINTLDVNDYFIYLCLHFIKHLPFDYFDKVIMQIDFTFNMQNLHDIVLLIDKNNKSINWEKIYNTVFEMKVCGYIFLASKMLNEIYPNRIPEDFLNQLYKHRHNSYIDVLGRNDQYWAAGRFLWLFDLSFHELCKNTVKDFMNGNLMLDLTEYINNTNKNEDVSDDTFNIQIDKKMEYYIEGSIYGDLDDLYINIKFINKTCYYYTGDNHIWNRDSIEIMFVNKNSIRALTIGPSLNDGNIILGIFDHNKGSYYEITDDKNYNFNIHENEFEILIKLSWDYLNINVNSGVPLFYNLAINYCDNKNEDTRKGQYKLFGSGFWWDFRECKKLIIRY